MAHNSSFTLFVIFVFKDPGSWYESDAVVSRRLLHFTTLRPKNCLILKMSLFRFRKSCHHRWSMIPGRERDESRLVFGGFSLPDTAQKSEAAQEDLVDFVGWWSLIM